MANEDLPDVDESDNAGVRIPPPFIYLVFLIIGLAIGSNWARGEVGDSANLLLGFIVFVIAGIIAAKSVPRHRKEGSNIEPWKPTAKIFSDGLYARSRNPIYLAMAIAYAGIAIAGGSIAALILLMPCLLVIQYYVVAREERYLLRKFGDEYKSYQSTVRRWI